jgi:hypothetical protein
MVHDVTWARTWTTTFTCLLIWHKANIKRTKILFYNFEYIVSLNSVNSFLWEWNLSTTNLKTNSKSTRLKLSSWIYFNDERRLIASPKCTSKGVYGLSKLNWFGQIHLIQPKKVGWVELLGRYEFQKEKS